MQLQRLFCNIGNYPYYFLIFVLIGYASSNAMAQVNAVNDNYATDIDISLNDNVLVNDSDVGGFNLSVNTTPVSGPANGILILSANGDFTYTPNASYTGGDSFTYEVCNDEPSPQCAQTTVDIMVMEPVNCNRNFYFGFNNPTDLNILNASADPYVFDLIRNDTEYYNAIGLNPVDGYIYAVSLEPGSEGHILKVDANGNRFDLGLPAGMPSAPAFYSGAFDRNGSYFIFQPQSNVSSPVNPESKLLEVDVTTSPPTINSITNYGSNTYQIADIAVNPNDGNIYGFESVVERRLAYINPSSPSTLNFFGPTRPAGIRAGSAFFDEFGDFYLYSNDTLAATPDQIYLYAIDVGVNGSGAGYFTEIGDGATTSFTDGCRCGFGVDIKTTVSVDTAVLNSIVTYTYSIINQSASAVTMDFIDNQDEGRTFVNGTLSNPFGGTVNAYGGTGTLDINGLSVPSGAQNDITVQVQIPNDPTISPVVYNQPLLDNFSDPNLPASMLSDDPSTGISPDRTRLNILFPPVAVDDSYSTNEDVVLNDNVLSNDLDPEGDNMIVNTTPVTDVANGTLVLNGDGTFTYTPNAEYSGSDSFTYEVCDDGTPSQCAQANASITVNAVNDAPLAVHNTFTTIMDAPVSGNLLDNDMDTENNNLSLAALPVSGPSQGTVTLNAAGTFTYTPNAGFTGLDQFEYEVCDDGTPSACATEMVYVRVFCDTRSTLDWGNYPLSYNPDGVLLEPDSFGITPIAIDPYNEISDFYIDDILKNTNSLVWLVEYSDVSHYSEIKLRFEQTLEFLTFTMFDVDKGGVGGHEDIIEIFAYNGSTVVNLTEDNFNHGASINYIGTNRFQGLYPSNFDETDGDIRFSFDVPLDSIVVRHSLPFLPGGSYTYGVSIHDISWCNALPLAADDAFTVDEDDPTANFNVSSNDNDTDGNFAPSTISIFSAPDQGGTATAQTDGTINYAPAANFNGTETVIYQICDGGGLCDQATVTFTVNAINDLPVAVDDSYTTPEDTPLVIAAAAGVLSNDTDIEADPLTASLVADVSNGTLTLSSDGSFNYTPNANFNGSDSFTYRANDGSGDSNTATVTITVTAVNDAPVALDDSYSTAEDNPLNITAASGVLSNDTDVESNPLNAILVANVSNGTLTLNGDGSFNYSPNTNFTGSDSFTYHANDGTGNSNIATVTITVTAVNDAPLAIDDPFSTDEDVILNGDLFTNDSDPESNNLSLNTTSVTNVSNGTLVLVGDGTFTYTPNADYFGPDSFTYEVCDDGTPSQCSQANVTITVNPINDAPVAIDDNWSTPEDTPINQNVLTNDSDLEGDGLTVNTVPVIGPSDGNVVILTNGDFTYTPNAGYSGNDTFTYQVCDDGTPSECNTAVVTINVNSVNDAPIANDDAPSTDEDVVLNGDVLTNDSDPELDLLTVNTTPIADVSNGSLVLNGDGTYTYTPDTDYNGSDSFTYEVCDNGSPVLCDQATVTITVNPVNDAPVALADSYTTPEDTPLSDDVSTNDSDIDLDGLFVTTTPVVDVSNGTLVLNTNGTFTYTPDPGYNGNDNFTYEICDNGTPTECATAAVSININSINDAPVAVDDNYATDEDMVLTDNIIGNDSDPDSDPLSVNTTPVSDVSNGTLILNSNGDFTYTPDADFNGSDSFTYEICDGGSLCDQATVTITVNPVNDTPVALADSYTTDEDVMLNENVLANDTDLENHNLTVNTSPVVDVSHGTLVLSANGDFAYTPAPDYNGSDTFTYELCDDGTPTECSQAVVNISILPIDDNLPPTATNLSITIAANSDTTFCINATDPNGDSLFIATILTPASNGNIILSNDNSLCLTYEPDKDFSGADQLELEICDGSICTSVTVNIMVEEPLLNIYQALSPNNDNYNDTWIIDGISRYPDNNIKIYNRYGDMVYQANGYNNENVIWKGEANNGLVLGNSQLPDGTYFYIINLGNGGNQLSGYVVLHR